MTILDDPKIYDIKKWVNEHIEDEFILNIKDFEEFIQNEIIPMHCPKFNFVDILELSSNYGSHWKIFISNTKTPYRLYAAKVISNDIEVNNVHETFINFLLKNQLICLNVTVTVTGVHVFYER